MSKFHADISEVLEDVHTFLQMTLQNEILSATALTHKESLIIKICALNASYPQLQLNLKDHLSTKQDGVTHSEVTSQPSSPPPYVDMNGTNSSNHLNFEYVSSDATQEESYDTCLNDRPSTEYTPATKTENTSAVKLDDEGEKDYPLVSAAELHSCEKNGYLEKKGRERLGFLNPFQRRWCAIKDGIMYYYERTTDRRQKGMIPLAGYQARPFHAPCKDTKKSSFCFELVCPGKRTYQFIAVSAKDMKQWIAAVERNSALASPQGMKTCLTPVYESSQNFMHFDSCDIEEDIYELVEDSKNSSTESDDQQLYDEGQSVIEQESANESSETFNYEEWYVGLWDCSADEPNELSFLRGELIHIISKEYDAKAWWVGEKSGRIGFVPKSYLMEAYEPC